MKSDLVGWDIGGAHVKAAGMNADGEVTGIYQQPCPLWKGMENLQQAVASILQHCINVPDVHVLTMTGELVDLFDHREQGVQQIITALTALLPNCKIFVFAGQQGFLQAHQLEARHYSAISSANWLASATFAAQQAGRGLFVDIGSTTTDILLLNEAQVQAQGYTDYKRLISQELIYSGIIRTAVMAVAQTALDKGEETGIMAEYFATMADVYRVTGELDEDHDQTETADGAEKTVVASARRLSRMIGCDFVPDELPRWQQFAKNIRSQQLLRIQQGCERQLSRTRDAAHCPLIGAGVGRFLVKQLALNLGHPYLDFNDLLPAPAVQTTMTAADCAPAVALVCLARALC